MRRTQLGRALRAIAESPKAARLLGINVEGLFYLTSFAAAALGGIGGVLIGLYSNAVFPLMGQPMLHKGIAVIILGGMGDIRGAMLRRPVPRLRRGAVGRLHRLDHARRGGLRPAVPRAAGAAARPVRQGAGAQGLTMGEWLDNFWVDLQQPGADAGHQRPARAVDLAHAVVRHAGDGQRRVHGHRRLHLGDPDDELRRAVSARHARRHRRARGGRPSSSASRRCGCRASTWRWPRSAFGEVVRVFLLNAESLTGGALGLNGIPQLTVVARAAGRRRRAFVLLRLALRGSAARSRRSSRRRGRRADGHRRPRHKMLAFVLGAAIAGLAGTLNAHLTFFIGPNEYGFDRGVEILTMTILGGVTSPWGR